MNSSLIEVSLAENLTIHEPHAECLTNEETINQLTAESREDIEKLCKIYDAKMKENEEERKGIEIHNKKLLGELKMKCEEIISRNENIEDLLNIKDMVKLITELEAEKCKRDTEIIRLQQNLTERDNNINALNKDLVCSREKICCLELIVNNLTSVIKQNDDKITETSALNEKLTVEITEKSREIQQLKSEKENTSHVTEVNLQKEVDIEIEKAKLITEEKNKAVDLTRQLEATDNSKKVTRSQSIKKNEIPSKKIIKKTDVGKEKPSKKNPEQKELQTATKGKEPSLRKPSIEVTLKPKPKTKIASEPLKSTEEVIIDGLKKELECEKKKVEEVESELRLQKDHYVGEINQLKLKIEKQESTFQDLNNELNGRKIEFDKLQGELCNSLRKLEALSESEKTLRIQLQEVISERTLQIETLTKKYHTEIGEIMVEFDLSKSELFEKRQKLELVASQLSVKEEEIGLLEEEIIKLKKESEEFAMMKNKNEINCQTEISNNSDENILEKSIADSINQLEVSTRPLEESEKSSTVIPDNKMDTVSIEKEEQPEQKNKIEKIESIPPHDSLWKEIMYENTISKLKNELLDISIRLKHNESKLDNAQEQLECQMQITEFIRRSLKLELEKQTNNQETWQILLNLSEKFNKLFLDNKIINSKETVSVAESTYASTRGSCNLGCFMYSADNGQADNNGLKESQYRKKKHIESLQHRVNIKIGGWMQKKLSQSFRSESFCHAGESALSPPLSKQLRQEDSRFCRGLELRDSLQDSGYIESNETVENLIRQVQDQALSLKNEGVSIPNQWFQEVRQWEERTLGEVNRLKFSQQEELSIKNDTNFKSIVYRPSNADVSSIIKRVNQEFARSQRMWSSD